LVANTVSGFKTSEQSSGSQTPKFGQKLSKFRAQERKMTILWKLWGPGTFWSTLTIADAAQTHFWGREGDGKEEHATVSFI